VDVFANSHNVIPLVEIVGYDTRQTLRGINQRERKPIHMLVNVFHSKSANRRDLYRQLSYYYFQ